ncbi:MAG: hypothetical protein K940chlam3_01002 [Chlamydiae bacterium]|nr:hypothetical protein [Chlamydiota bacterium]
MKKANKKKTIEVEPIEVSTSSINTHRLIEFVQDYGTSIVYGILGLLVAIVILYQFTRSSESHNFSDYMRADRIYQQFIQEINSEQLEKLEQLMARHPDLKQKYEGKIAQALIAKGHPELAAPYIDGVIQRSEEENFPWFLDYTKTTQLITQENYEEAYQQAQDLQAQLEDQQQVPYYQQLFAYNLLRLATLEQQLGLREPELAHWEEILVTAEENGAMMGLLRHLQEGHVNLTSYIEYRIAQLQG